MTLTPTKMRMIRPNLLTRLSSVDRVLSLVVESTVVAAESAPPGLDDDDPDTAPVRFPAVPEVLGKNDPSDRPRSVALPA